ncbi:sigma factor-like helix-turn-helix DNA-binding protein [Streptomyces buecherae]|uniref:sigma factor-like helix-turn-helix DNA-binding protein n=1 Tax=Streptomyces buecherae TaxID=2763006 RepID=UPI0027E2EA11|nr:sigma factor-like helix-turn-helix DNA-binding protein [Streptomyces buecherae]
MNAADEPTDIANGRTRHGTSAHERSAPAALRSHRASATVAIAHARWAARPGVAGRRLTGDQVWDAVAESERPSEADAVDQLLERVQLGEALRRLSPEHREAVVEVYFGGRTCAELGAELGVPASTLRSRLYYGVRALRLILEENGWLAP